MKQFKKTENGFFICEECGKILSKFTNSLTRHVRTYHHSKNYYDKWLKEENDGKCKICKEETEFLSIIKGYRNCCCKKCLDKYTDIRTKKSMNEKFHSDSPFSSKKVRNKSKKTLIKRYGVDHNFKMEQVKTDRIKTWIKTLGVNNPSQSKEIKDKKEKTCLKNYGYKSGFCNLVKRIKTFNERYNCDYPSQNPKIFEKAQISGKLIHKFKETNLYYRGSYELDFLEKFSNQYPDLINAPSISYKFENKNRIYHPDFYIPSMNLIIECKNSYLAKRDKDLIETKRKAAISNGFEYIMIIDKDYSKFDKSSL